MMSNVNGILLRTEHLAGLRMLNHAQLGTLVLALFADACGEEMPDMDDITRLAFELVAPSVRRANDTYAQRCAVNADNGRKGGRPRKQAAQEDAGAQPSHTSATESEKPTGLRVETEKTEPKTEKPMGFCNETEKPNEAKRNRKEKENIYTTPPTRLPEIEDLAGRGEGGDGAGHACLFEPPDMGFLQVWDAYPAVRRGPVADAIIAWKALARSRALPGLPALLNGITRWMDSDAWQRENGRFVPYLANFLRRRLWEEPVPPVEAVRGMSLTGTAAAMIAQHDAWAKELLSVKEEAAA